VVRKENSETGQRAADLIVVHGFPNASYEAREHIESLRDGVTYGQVIGSAPVPAM